MSFFIWPVVVLLLASPGASPVMRSVRVSGSTCAVVERKAPLFKPVTLSEWPAPCGDHGVWSPDGSRLMFQGPPPVLVEIAARQHRELPALAQKHSSWMAFDNRGRALVFGTLYDSSGRGTAWADLLDANGWKRIETVSFADESVEFGSFEHLNTYQQLKDQHPLKRRKANPSEQKALSGIKLGNEEYWWEVATAPAGTVAFSTGPFDFFMADAPIVVLAKGKPVPLSFTGWPEGKFRFLQIVGSVLLVDNMPNVPGKLVPVDKEDKEPGRDIEYRAVLVDLGTGNVLVELPPDERLAQLFD